MSKYLSRINLDDILYGALGSLTMGVIIASLGSLSLYEFIRVTFLGMLFSIVMVLHRRSEIVEH